MPTGDGYLNRGSAYVQTGQFEFAGEDLNWGQYYFVRIDTRHFAGADGIENGGAVRGKLKGVAVAARNQYRTAALLFLCGSGGKTIIRLEAGRFRSARG